MPGLVRTSEPSSSLMMSPVPVMRPENVAAWTTLEEWVALANQKRTPPLRVMGPASSIPKPWLFVTSTFWPAKVTGVVIAMVLLVARTG